MWLPAVTIVPPAGGPVTLEAAKAFLRIEAEDDSFDAELATIIAGVADEVERITGTRLITQTVRIGARTFADLDQLPIGPVQDVTAIAWDDAEGAAQAMDPAAWELFGEGLYRGLRPVAGQSWPTGLRCALGAVRVTAVVGYGADGADLPGSLYAALLRAVRGEFDGAGLAIEPLLVNHRIWL